MTAEQQLERSVLEGKERDELHAIAQAMSLKTTTRTKKADIIDRILEATGISAPTAAPAAAAPTVSAPSDGAVAPARSGGNGRSARGAAAAAAALAAAAVAAEPTESPANVPAMDAAPVIEVAREDRSGTADNRTEDSTDSTGNGTDHAGGNGETPTVTSTSTAEFVPAADNGHDANGGGNNNGNGGNATGRQPQQNRPQNRQNQQHSNNSNSNSNSNQAQGLDAGNRRGRRRRGRERGQGPERDLQGVASQESPYSGELVEVRGLLDLRDEGYGFLRCDGYLPSSKDVYVSISQARRFALRRGDYVEGACRPAASNEKYPALLRIDRVSTLDPEVARNRPRFEDLTPLFPDQRLTLEMPGAKENVTARIVDLLSPIGKGQRGLIVSPPKAGKTTVMKQIAHSIEANNPDVHLMVLLVDERPEEVTDMRRSVKGEVVASTFDRPSDEHTTVAELAIERAKRLVEMGRDVVIILDGITRLARAYNLAQPATGRIMSGGVDSGALYPPKKFFGAARNIEEGGSLTILATALVETGSKMDEVIFEEFKGTGNMELRLDRRLAERRLYPSIDVNASSTRHEELLFDRGQLQQVWKLRRVLNALASEGNAAAGLELLMDRLRTTKSNDDFLAEIAKSPTPN
jgi:transcription termination factor Rho